MNEDAMARLRAEVIAEREKAMASSDETKAKLRGALRRKEDQVTRIINAIVDAGHNPALIAKLAQLEAEAASHKTDLEVLETAEPPAPPEMTDDVDALIQNAARDIERVISGGTHPDAPKLREMVRSMIERITISRHESGVIGVGVCGALAGVMQVAGLVERPSIAAALPTTKAPEPFGLGAF